MAFKYYLRSVLTQQRGVGFRRLCLSIPDQRAYQNGFPSNALDAQLAACTDERSAGVHGYIPANKDFRDRDTSIKNTDYFLARHAEPVLLDGCGFIVYMLKVQGDDDACIFLKDNRCSIQEVKPSACRIYPLVASPTANGRFEYMVCFEQPHHFKGAVVSVKRWINRVFFAKEKEALYMDYQSVPKIASLLRRIPEHNRNRAIALFLWYRYSGHDLERSFLEQFSSNMEKLQMELRALAAK